MCQIFLLVKSVVPPQIVTITSKVYLNNVPVCVYELSARKTCPETAFQQGKGHIFSPSSDPTRFIVYLFVGVALINNSVSQTLRNASIHACSKISFAFFRK